MELSRLFHSEDVLVGFRSADKWDAIDRMIDRLVATGHVDDETAPAIREAVLARERSMSTGMERGIAIPHAAVDELDEVVASLAVAADPEGISFESVDARPTRIVVLLLIPKAQKLLHIRTLADVARVLGQEPVQQALFAARTGEEAWHALAEGERAHPSS